KLAELVESGSGEQGHGRQPVPPIIDVVVAGLIEQLPLRAGAAGEDAAREEPVELLYGEIVGRSLRPCLARHLDLDADPRVLVDLPGRFRPLEETAERVDVLALDRDARDHTRLAARTRLPYAIGCREVAVLGALGPALRIVRHVLAVLARHRAGDV